MRKKLPQPVTFSGQLVRALLNPPLIRHSHPEATSESLSSLVLDRWNSLSLFNSQTLSVVKQSIVRFGLWALSKRHFSPAPAVRSLLLICEPTYSTTLNARQEKGSNLHSQSFRSGVLPLDDLISNPLFQVQLYLFEAT